MTRWTLGALALAASACSTAPLHMTREVFSLPPGERPAEAQQTSTAAAAPAATGDAPRVWVAPIHDRRPDPSLGSAAGRQVSASGEVLGDWLNDALAGKGAGRFGVFLGGAPPAGVRVEVQPRILKAYVASVTTNLTAAVVLEVELRAPGAAPVKRIYRGQENKVNWASGDGEIAGVLRIALEKAAERAVLDIDGALLGN